MCKLLAILISLALLLGASGALAEAQPRSFGYLAWQMEDLRCATSALAFEYAAQRYGASVVCRDAEDDAEKASTALQELIDAQVDGIVIYGYTADAVLPLLTAAQAASIPVVVENVDVATVAEADAYVAALGSTPASRSYAVVEYLVQNHGSITLFHCAGPEGDPATQDCADGLSLADSELGVDMAGTLNGERTQAGGESLTDILINSFTDFDSILADSDAMAQGSRNSVSNAGYKGIEIVSQGDSPDALSLVEGGIVSAVASSPSAIQGMASCKILWEYLNDGTVPELKFQALPALSVSAESLESWESFEAYEYAYEYVYSGAPLEEFDLDAMEERIAADLEAQALEAQSAGQPAQSEVPTQ